jgi:proteasome lid subunit RPN8/RPN11
VRNVCIHGAILKSLREAAAREPQRECCGLLGGRGGAITTIYPAGNAAQIPSTSYEIAPRDLFRIMREIRASRLELLGIYHSHPNGDNSPSRRDIERAFYAEVAYFILSPRPDAPKPIRAFSICDGVATELPVEIV